ncbi:MAG: ATP-dependent DNA ligase [Saprospiraceae bacterium]|nr:ATP-dependent DNA ligase [Saprospiraceae bacterium]
MKHFADLFEALDQTTKTTAKVGALAGYFARATTEDRLWTMALLSHKRPRRTVTTTLLRTWAAEEANLPLWLFEESYHIVGDLAEAIALVLPKPEGQSTKSLSEWINIIRSLKDETDEVKRETITKAWSVLNHQERFVFNKLITGGFRIGVSQKLMTRALAQATGLDENIIAQRLMGNWTPDETTFERLLFEEKPEDKLSRPYPFYLAYALDLDPTSLGPVADWQVERKWDGIRGQVIIRESHLFVWSRGEELVTDRFPEFEMLAESFPKGVVIDGEILPWKEGNPLPFQLLQTRIGRKKLSKKALETAPVILMAYDLLEYDGDDYRSHPLETRREKLVAVVNEVNCDALKLSPLVKTEDWLALNEERKKSRAHHCEGFMLKRKDSIYKQGRKKGDWWKWKIDPLTIDAVMLYAQQGHGRRANLFTDYTFAVWDGDNLVPFAKAYSGLTDGEFKEITRFVRQHTLDRYGPVRAVKPQLVFELAFEGIQRSTRHKSGVALRFPRMLRWRKDKKASEANSLVDLKGMLDLYG